MSDDIDWTDLSDPPCYPKIIETQSATPAPVAAPRTLDTSGWDEWVWLRRAIHAYRIADDATYNRLVAFLEELRAKFAAASAPVPEAATTDAQMLDAIADALGVDTGLVEAAQAAKDEAEHLRARLAALEAENARLHEQAEERSAVHLRRYRRLADAIGNPMLSVDSMLDKVLAALRASSGAARTGDGR